jgi:hypothetical protein
MLMRTKINVLFILQVLDEMSEWDSRWDGKPIAFFDQSISLLTS